MFSGLTGRRLFSHIKNADPTLEMIDSRLMLKASSTLISLRVRVTRVTSQRLVPMDRTFPSKKWQP